ncbi:glycosyl transferase family 2 [candidate division BRC1 bacterium HGW-BRC1-1]|jgi:dolichyl-phosphate beta-glucosyltransferase|nr:MAG: glycosyl transferase family 2 [candidate division BRC1 bacterium HGW-BRC1-1]
MQEAPPAPPHLSVIIPAYNEEKRLGATLARMIAYLEAQPYTWELVVVDDGSSDSTAAVADAAGDGGRLAVRVLRNSPNRGKGFSIRRGMLEARGKYRLFSDADLSTPIEEVEAFWSHFEKGAAVVIGSRALKESHLTVRQSPMREGAGRVFNSCVRWMLVPGIHDTQCGFKMFTAEAAEAVFPKQRMHGFSFDVEILMLARRAGFEVRELPVTWTNAPGTKVSAWKGATAFWDLVVLKLRHCRR